MHEPLLPRTHTGGGWWYTWTKTNLKKEMSAFSSLLGTSQSLCLCWKRKALPLANHSFFCFILAWMMRKMIKLTSRMVKILNGQNAGPLVHHRTEPQPWFQIVCNYDVAYVNIRGVEGCSYLDSQWSGDFCNSTLFKSFGSSPTICVWIGVFLPALISCLLLKMKVSLSVFLHIK